jgi:NDP-sugar pyrophosphorylase family protein
MNGDVLSLISFRRLYDFALEQDSLLTVGIKKIVMPYAFGNIFLKEIQSQKLKKNLI